VVRFSYYAVARHSWRPYVPCTYSPCISPSLSP
jgi:hypothetical protein